MKERQIEKMIYKNEGKTDREKIFVILETRSAFNSVGIADMM